MTDPRIDALATQKYVWLISPDGLPTKIPTDKHVANGLLIPPAECEDATMLLPSALEAGWSLMEKDCSKEAWKAWQAVDQESQKPGGHGRFKLTREVVKLLPERVRKAYAFHPTLGDHVDGQGDAPASPSRTAGRAAG